MFKRALPILLTALLILVAQPVSAQTYPRRIPNAPPEAERYQESALRRFEIISISSLPFTTIESFLVVRGVEMAKQNKFSPELSDGNFIAIAALAVSSSMMIGFWDWLHTHDKDTSQPRIPKRSKVPGFNSEPLESDSSTLPSDGLTLALIQARF